MVINTKSKKTATAEPKSYKYGTLQSAYEDIRSDVVYRAMENRELVEKYFPLIRGGVTLSAMKQLLFKSGLQKLRETVKSRMDAYTKANIESAVKEAKIRLKREIAGQIRLAEHKKVMEQEVDHVAKLRKQRADAHFGTMDKLVGMARKELESRPVNGKTNPIDYFLSNAAKFDKLARTTYGLDDKEAVTSKQFSMTVLMHSDMIRPVEGRIIEQEHAQLTDEEIIALESGEFSAPIQDVAEDDSQGDDELPAEEDGSELVEE